MFGFSQRCGLKNFGTSCFVNAGLQVLCALYFTLPCFATGVRASAAAGLVPIAVVLAAIDAMAKLPGGVFHPYGVVNMVRKLSATLFPKGTASGQADAGELLAALVDLTAPHAAAAFGRFLETKTCSKCHLSYTRSAATSTVVPLALVSGQLAVNLASFGLPEALTGANRYECPTCKQLVDAVMTNRFEPGELVFLQLVRERTELVTGLDGNSTCVTVRMDDCVEFPEYLAINDKTFHRVAAIMYHASKKHYTTFFPKGDTGFEIDDEKVNDNVLFDGSAASVFVYVVRFHVVFYVSFFNH
jgi:hypothetical protein